ncbi:hypothetical protein BD626DRAFT_573846 [Schizophyllum amplum]|uniref:Uncharacterized protein n=1 Tax=Schizophyllum amplum TaxID=97359 RepID=A0A550C081_9AGAR|nr:hypothetical protein BD626DRAFT_573846 [Auriculariopsis ampla]
MPAEITLESASFVGIVLETLGFGVFNALFIATVVALVRRARTEGHFNWALLGTLVVICALTWTHWIINIGRASRAFVNAQAEPGGAAIFYADLSAPSYAAKTAVYVMLTFVGDTFVTYRTWVVWARNYYVAILPALMCIGTLSVGSVATAKFTVLKAGDLIFAASLVPWVTSFIIMSLGTNVLCTLLIAARILATQRRLADSYISTRITSALALVVESAAAYSAALIALVTVYLIGSNGQYAILDLTAPLIGITFAMIIIRVSLADAASQRTASSRELQPWRVSTRPAPMSPRPWQEESKNWPPSPTVRSPSWKPSGASGWPKPPPPPRPSSPVAISVVVEMDSDAHSLFDTVETKRVSGP